MRVEESILLVVCECEFLYERGLDLCFVMESMLQSMVSNGCTCDDELFV
jgi:hypothetical protein